MSFVLIDILVSEKTNVQKGYQCIVFEVHNSVSFSKNLLNIHLFNIKQIFIAFLTGFNRSDIKYESNYDDNKR